MKEPWRMIGGPPDSTRAPWDGGPTLVCGGDLEFPYVCRWVDPRRDGLPAHLIGNKTAEEPYWQEAAGERYAIYRPTHWLPLDALPPQPKP